MAEVIEELVLEVEAIEIDPEADQEIEQRIDQTADRIAKAE